MDHSYNLEGPRNEPRNEHRAEACSCAEPGCDHSLKTVELKQTSGRHHHQSCPARPARRPLDQKTPSQPAAILPKVKLQTNVDVQTWMQKMMKAVVSDWAITGAEQIFPGLPLLVICSTTIQSADVKRLCTALQ